MAFPTFLYVVERCEVIASASISPVEAVAAEEEVEVLLASAAVQVREA